MPTTSCSRAHAGRAWWFLLPLVLGACLPEGGYEKVIYRELEELPAPAAPNPPPVRAGAGGGAGPQLANVTLPAGVTPAMVEQGQQNFALCAGCHGANGAGTPIAPALNDNQWLNISGNDFDELVQVITTGVPQPKQYPAGMPPKGGGAFTDEQVRALAAYVYALSHAGSGS